MENNVTRCVLCGEVYAGYGHNPEPVAKFEDGHCCESCNNNRVIPARMVGMFLADERRQIEEDADESVTCAICDQPIKGRQSPIWTHIDLEDGRRGQVPCHFECLSAVLDKVENRTSQKETSEPPS